MASVSVDDVRDVINVSSAEVPDAKVLKIIKRTEVMLYWMILFKVYKDFWTYSNLVLKTLAGLRIQLPDELERLFREMSMKRFGYGKGSISRAAQEAIQKWLEAELRLEKSEFEGDPVKAIEGLLADVEMDSVELQHLAGKIWVKKVLANVSR